MSNEQNQDVTKGTAMSADNSGAAASQPPDEHPDRKPLTILPTAGGDFLSFELLLPRLPVCERSAREWTRKGILPSIRLPNSRRVLYHWPSVAQALLRLQRGGDL